MTAPAPGSSDHQPQRPEWTCRVCGRPWPCPVRRAELLAEHGQERVWLGLYMAAYLADALGDLRGKEEPWITAIRFRGWVRGPTVADAVDRDPT